MAIAERSLRRREWRILVILGVPTFALALGVTTVSTYLPVLADDFSNSSIVVGLLIGGEGLMALWLPLVVGSWSDRLRTPIGGRLPFIIVATPPLVVALALIGFVHSVAAAAILVAVFFMGYFVAYEPYRALYPDLVDHEIAGRAQSTQAIFRGIGTFLALLGGGMLISISDPLPFLAAAGVVAVCMAAFAATSVRYRRRETSSGEADIVQVAFRIVDLIRCQSHLQAFLVANALWELALAALKTFIVLYVTRTLGFSLAGSSGGHRRRGPDRPRRSGDQRPAGRPLRAHARDALVAGAVRLRSARALPDDGDRTAARGRPAHRLRRRRDDVASLCAAHPDDARWRARRGHGAVLAQPRPRHLARSAPRRRGDRGCGRGLPLGLARVLGGDRGLAAGHAPPPRRGMTPRGVSLGSSPS
jgi:hypothetical protein